MAGRDRRLAAGRTARPGQRVPRARLAFEADAGPAADAADEDDGWHGDEDAGDAFASSGAEDADQDSAGAGAGAAGSNATRQRTQRRLAAWAARQAQDAADVRLSAFQRADADAVQGRRERASAQLTEALQQRMAEACVCCSCGGCEWELQPGSAGAATVLVVTAAAAFRWPVPQFTCTGCGAPAAEPDLVSVGYWPSTPTQPEVWFEQPLMHWALTMQLGGSSLELIVGGAQDLLGHPILLGELNLLPSKE